MSNNKIEELIKTAYNKLLMLANDPAMIYQNYQHGDQIVFNTDWVCTCGQPMCTLTAKKGAVYEVEKDFGSGVELVFMPGAFVDKQYIDLHAPRNNTQYINVNNWAGPGPSSSIQLDPPQTSWADFYGEMQGCTHKWKLYEGIINRYEYCENCDEKRET